MATGRTYDVEVSRPAAKSLQAIPKKAQRRITEAIDSLSTDPRPHGCEKLTDREDEYRIRVGNYRIIYEIVDKRLFVLVLSIGDRKDVYR
jgi:mRNA interferase RelE/StbE